MELRNCDPLGLVEPRPEPLHAWPMPELRMADINIRKRMDVPQ